MTECLWSLCPHRPPSPYCTHCSVSPLRCYHSTVRWKMREMLGNWTLGDKMGEQRKDDFGAEGGMRDSACSGDPSDFAWNLVWRASQRLQWLQICGLWKKLNIYEKLGKKELRSASYRRYAWDVRQAKVTFEANKPIWAPRVWPIYSGLPHAKGGSRLSYALQVKRNDLVVYLRNWAKLNRDLLLWMWAKGGSAFFAAGFYPEEPNVTW